MRSSGIVGVSVIPHVKSWPINGLIKTEEFDLVTGGDGMDQSIIKTDFEWDLISTLLSVANKPPKKMKSVEVNLQNPFSIEMSFVCMRTQLRRLQLVDKMKNVVGSSPKAVWLKIVVSPPVVGVSVLERSNIRICTVT